MIKLVYFLSALSGIFIGINFHLNIFYLPFIFFFSLLTKKKTFILSSLFFISTLISSSISNRGGEKSKFIKEIENSKFVIIKTESISPFSSSFIGETDSEKYLLRFKKRIEFDRGEIIKVKSARIEEIKGKKNPWDFDRKKYYRRRRIFYQLKVEEFERTGYKNIFYKVISKIRKKGKEKIKENLLYKPEEKELIETIVIGKDKIPYFLKTLGIKSGSYHLLVISGLHLSFIFFFLKVLFLPLMRLNNTHPKVFPFFALLSIWFYAFITGLRIPVVRASLMFTFFLLGEIFERDIEGPDSLFIAAFILLLLNPFSLFNLSFLLSFITTFTIIYTVRKFNYIRNPFLMFLSITTFAQISAFPVILYNFKRFYITGFFSNIFLIPLSVGLIIFSLLSFIFPFLFTFTGFLADIFLKLMHIFSFKSPEFNFITPLSFIIFWYSLLVFALLKNPPKLKKFFLVVSSLSFLFSLFQLSYANKGEKIYFFSSKKPCIFIKVREKGILFSPDDFKNRRFLKSLISFLKSKKVKKITLIYTDDSLNHLGTLNLLRRYFVVEDVCGFRKKWSEKEGYKIRREGYKIRRDRKNFIIEKNNLKILLSIYFNKSVEKREFNIFYLYNYKKKKNVVENIKKVSSTVRIFPARLKKYEKIQKKFWNFFLDDGCVIIEEKNNSLNIRQL